MTSRWLAGHDFVTEHHVHVQLGTSPTKISRQRSVHFLLQLWLWRPLLTGEVEAEEIEHLRLHPQSPRPHREDVVRIPRDLLHACKSPEHAGDKLVVILFG